MPHCLMNLRGRVMVFDAFQYLRVLREHWQLFLLHLDLTAHVVLSLFYTPWWWEGCFSTF